MRSEHVKRSTRKFTAADNRHREEEKLKAGMQLKVNLEDK